MEFVVALVVLAAIAGLYWLLRKPELPQIPETKLDVDQLAPYKREPRAPTTDLPILTEVVSPAPIFEVLEPTPAVEQPAPAQPEPVVAAKKPRAPRAAKKAAAPAPSMANVKSVAKKVGATPQTKSAPAKKRATKKEV